MNQQKGTLQTLSALDKLISEINSTNSSNEKLEILAKHPECKEFIALVMDPMTTTGVTRTQIKKRMKGARRPHLEIQDLMGQLYDRTLSGHAALDAVCDLIAAFPAFEELILRIVEKNLKWRMDVKQINKVFPNLIKTFSVALAEDMKKSASYFAKNSKHQWFISRKFDGVRVITVRDGCFSRTGKEFVALKPLHDLAKPYLEAKRYVLDGEVCSVDEKTGAENFTAAVSQVKRKSAQMTSFRYYVFDILSEEEFFAGESKTTLSERLSGRAVELKELFALPQFTLVEQIPYTESTFDQLKKQSVECKWEGLMLRMDAPYKGKRSKDILKWKQFETEEFKVLEVEHSVMRIIDQDSGLEIEEEMLSSVVIEHNGNRVNVGSGFTIDERRRFYHDETLILNKKITVQYFPDPDIVMRFPIFKALWEEGERDI